MKLRNFTPHEVTIFLDGRVITIQSEGSARVSSRSIPLCEIDGIPVAQTIFEEVCGLPDPDPDTFLIVSQIVIAALPQRGDLLRPDSGPESAVRDAKGIIIGVKGLTR
jgi:hypothetical protein